MSFMVCISNQCVTIYFLQHFRLQMMTRERLGHKPNRELFRTAEGIRSLLARSGYTTGLRRGWALWVEQTISCYPKENSVALTFSKTKLGASVTWWDQYRWQRIIILLCNLVNLYLGEMFQKSARRRREIFDKICIPKPIFLYKNRVFRRISGTKFPKNFRRLRRRFNQKTMVFIPPAGLPKIWYKIAG